MRTAGTNSQRDCIFRSCLHQQFLRKTVFLLLIRIRGVFGHRVSTSKMPRNVP